jgi:two-component system response regulator AtoC
VITSKPKILIVDDEPSILNSLKLLLSSRYEVGGVETGLQAIDIIDNFKPDVILLDLLLPDLDGIETLKQLKEKNPKIPIVMLSGANGVKSAVEAMKCGAVDYINKPFDFPELEKLLLGVILSARTASDAVEVLNEIIVVKTSDNPEPTKLVGESCSMLEVIRKIDQVAERDTTVLITGESGTGKEIVARRIHEKSTRANGNFVAINCGAIPESLIESELFGHEKGAFTHAVEKRIGHCELADGGTLFLDEIGELSLNVQVKLLRFLQEQEFFRVGRSKSIKVDVRIIAATNRKLEDLIHEKRFRSDLYYRINVVNFALPPLRERIEDIPILVKHFIEKLSPRYGGRKIKFTQEAMNALAKYRWPGNIRELENSLESLFALTSKDTITLSDLSPKIQAYISGRSNSQDEAVINIAEATDALNREMIEKALKEAHQNQTKAAAALGVTRRMLKYKMDKLGIGSK